MAKAERAPAAEPGVLERGEPGWQVRVDWPTRFRLYSGLVLFVFVLSHFANHALGLISLDAMEEGRLVFIAIWRSQPGTVALYGSLTVHFAFALWKIYRRRGMKMHWWEVLQIVLGLIIPILMLPHVLNTRIANTAFQVDDLYIYVLLDIWASGSTVTQHILLIVVWAHGCIGIHYWLRLKKWYRRLMLLWITFALTVPILAISGFVVRSQTAIDLARNPGYRNLLRDRVNWPSRTAEEVINGIQWNLLIGIGVILALVLAARGVRWLIGIKRKTVRIRYPGGRIVEIQRGHSVLEASKIAGMPHAAVCGGRGRCSTCRVRVGKGLASLPPPNDDERDVLNRVRAGPSERLACQIRPLSEIEVTPLLPDTAGPADADGRPAYIKGARHEVTILIADLRGARPLVEGTDNDELVFLVNQYYRAMAGCIEQLGGRVERFDGGRITAIFGIGGDTRTGAAAAIGSACLMEDALAQFCSTFEKDLKDAGVAAVLRLGTGIHTGSALVGEIGEYARPVLTAIGAVALITGRLQAAAIAYDCPVMISGVTAKKASVDLAKFKRQEVYIRRGEDPIEAFAIDTIRGLAETMLLQIAKIQAAMKDAPPDAVSPESRPEA